MTESESFSDPGIIDIQRLNMLGVQNVCSRLLTEVWVGAARQKTGGESKGLNPNRLMECIHVRRAVGPGLKVCEGVRVISSEFKCEVVEFKHGALEGFDSQLF